MTDRKFVDFDRNNISDVAKYVKGYVSENEGCQVYVGGDSQVHRSFVRYVTAVCLYVPGSGAHLVYESVKKPLKADLFSRLWEEVVNVVDVAAYIRDNTGLEVRTHFDINPDDSYGSHVVYRAAMGYAKGAGFPFKVKPEAWAATCAADHLCK
jgi:hypothetical protein